MLKRAGTPCPRCIGGSMFYDFMLADLLCLQCGQVGLRVVREISLGEGYNSVWGRHYNQRGNQRKT